MYDFAAAGARGFGLERRLVLADDAVGPAIVGGRPGLDCTRRVRRLGPEEGITALRNAEPP